MHLGTKYKQDQLMSKFQFHYICNSNDIQESSPMFFLNRITQCIVLYHYLYISTSKTKFANSFFFFEKIKLTTLYTTHHHEYIQQYFSYIATRSIEHYGLNIQLDMCLWNTDAPGGNKVKLWQKSLSPTFWPAPHPEACDVSEVWIILRWSFNPS